jgi:hypothetical protein
VGRAVTGTTQTKTRARAEGVFVSEAEFQSKVRALCRFYGLTVYHTHNSQRSDPGFPDLVIVGSSGILFRELKTETGRLTAMQKHWISILQAAGQDADVWRPSDLDRIKLELKALGPVQIQQPLAVIKRRLGKGK